MSLPLKSPFCIFSIIFLRFLIPLLSFYHTTSRFSIFFSYYFSYSCHFRESPISSLIPNEEFFSWRLFSLIHAIFLCLWTRIMKFWRCMSRATFSRFWNLPSNFFLFCSLNFSCCFPFISNFSRNLDNKEIPLRHTFASFHPLKIEYSIRVQLQATTSNLKVYTNGIFYSATTHQYTRCVYNNKRHKFYCPRTQHNCPRFHMEIYGVAIRGSVLAL